MLKFPPSGQSKPTELSYTNSCFSEHIASSIFNMLGIPAQETMLGTFEINGRKINYYDFLVEAGDTECNKAVERIYGRLDVKKIHTFIDKTPYISNLQKEFYKKYIDARIKLILSPAHDMIVSCFHENLHAAFVMHF